MPVTDALRRLRDDIEAYMGSYIKVIARLYLGPKKQRPTEKQEKTETTEADGKTENTYFPTRVVDSADALLKSKANIALSEKEKKTG